jgi:hypothetical protein
MEKAIAERFACTSHPKKRPRTKDDDDDEEEDSEMTLNGCLPGRDAKTREPPELDATHGRILAVNASALKNRS